MNSIFNVTIGPLLTYCLSLLTLIAFSVYVLFRVKSPQILREKIWRSFVGDVGFNEDFLQVFSAQQRDLNQFRLVYGVGARSTSQLRTLLAWMERKAVTIDEVRRARNWIDLEKPQVLLTPPRRLFVLLPILIGVCGLVFALLLVAADSPSALIKTRVSGVWFWSDGKSAQSLMHRWVFDAQSCSAHTIPDQSVTGFTGRETQSLCTGISDDTVAKVVRPALMSQRVALVIVSCCPFIALVMFFFALQAGCHARELCNRLNQGASPEPVADDNESDEIEFAPGDG